MSAHAYETHALVTAATAAQVSWSTAVAEATGGEVWREAGALCVHHPQPYDEAIVLFPPRPDGSAIDRILERCSELRIPRIGCWTTGLGDDERLRGVLEPRRFEEGWRPHWMCRELTAGAPVDPRVAAVTEVREYDEYGQALLALTRGPERRSWHFVARENGALAGMAWLHVPDTAPFAGGVFDVSVPELVRGRGLGRALTDAVCNQALELGCTHAVLNATGDGEELYGALGFRSLGRGRTWWLRLSR
jgi:GNAT superfamily N-acetyltransferase